MEVKSYWHIAEFFVGDGFIIVLREPFENIWMIQNGLYGLGFIRVGNEPVTVFYYRGDDRTTKHMLKERTVRGELYQERLLVSEIRGRERIEVVIESVDSGKRIADSDSWPK